jgi:hypothetical protein
MHLSRAVFCPLVHIGYHNHPYGVVNRRYAALVDINDIHESGNKQSSQDHVGVGMHVVVPLHHAGPALHRRHDNGAWATGRLWPIKKMLTARQGQSPIKRS